MHHRTLTEITQVASVEPVATLSPRQRRRQRLNRFANLLEAHGGPIRLFSRIEYLSLNERDALRADLSPLAVAYADAEFRRAGLIGDTVKDAKQFFDLSDGEVHTLFCDCHFGQLMDGRSMASGIRRIADRISLRERLESIRAYFSQAG